MLEILTPSLHLLPARQHVRLYYCGHFVILPDVGFTSGLGLLPLGLADIVCKILGIIMCKAFVATAFMVKTRS